MSRLDKENDFFGICKTISGNLNKNKPSVQARHPHPEPIASFQTRKKEIMQHITLGNHSSTTPQEHKPVHSRFKTRTQAQEEKVRNAILIDDDSEDNVETQKELEKLKEKHARQKENLEKMHRHLTNSVVSGKRIAVLDLEEISPQGNGEVNKVQKLNSMQSNIVPTKSVFKSELTPYKPVKGTKKELTPIVAIDCEMVNCEGNIHALARCSIVDYNGHVLFDQIIKPKWRVTNYLTWVSGITPAKLKNAGTYDHHIGEILDILKNRIIIGHSIKNDFDALNFYPDKKYVRDLVQYKGLKVNGKVVGLKIMTEKFLGMHIQDGQHNSVEDARATMALYRMVEKTWEDQLKSPTYDSLLKKS